MGSMPIVAVFVWFLSCFSAQAGVMDPFSKSSRIVVIGAGPSGLHMASRLKRLGYTNVTILERSHRVGGKSFTIYRDSAGECQQQKDNNSGLVDIEKCIAHEMGTCFLHNGYHTTRALVEEYGLMPGFPPEGRAMFSAFAADQWSSQEMSDFISSAIMTGIRDGSIRKSWWVPSFSETFTVMYALLKAVEEYNKLHAEIFGSVEFAMPERLSPSALNRLDMTFYEFLKRNNLQALIAFLTFAHAAQGYGYVKSISAYYGLLWVSPELLNGYVQMSMHQKIEECRLMAQVSDAPIMKHFIKILTSIFVGGDALAVSRTTTMLPEGFGKLWQAMHEQDDLDVRFGVEISSNGINRQLDQPTASVKVTYRQDGGSWQTAEYDFLLYTAPFIHASKYVKDMSIPEHTIFKKLKSFVLATTLYQSDAVKSYSDPEAGDAPIMYNTVKMENSTMDGSWYADRNDPRIFGNDRRKHHQTRVGYQFFENYCAFDVALCDSDRTPDKTTFSSTRFATAPKVLERFQQELEAQRVGNVKIIEQFPWPYFHHFPQEALNAGMPWDLVEMQGLQKTWWLGASASFESVHDVTNYNMMILKKYLSSNKLDIAQKLDSKVTDVLAVTAETPVLV